MKALRALEVAEPEPDGKYVLTIRQRWPPHERERDISRPSGSARTAALGTVTKPRSRREVRTRMATPEADSAEPRLPSPQKTV